MRKSITRLLFVQLCMLGTIAQSAIAAERTPEEVVRAYTDAANRHDLEAFLALYSPTIRKFRFPGQMTSEGIEHKTAEELTVYQVQDGRITNIVYVEQRVL